MYPLLLEIGPVTFYSLWIFIAVGFFAALLIMNKLINSTYAPPGWSREGHVLPAH